MDYRDCFLSRALLAWGTHCHQIRQWQLAHRFWSTRELCRVTSYLKWNLQSWRQSTSPLQLQEKRGAFLWALVGCPETVGKVNPLEKGRWAGWA